MSSGGNCISIPAWNCELATARQVESAISHVGYRSHQIRFLDSVSGQNCFPCWLVSANEAPHEMTLYLRLHNCPEPGDPAHLQADVPKELWRTLSAQQQPWNIQLDPTRLLLLR